MARPKSPTPSLRYHISGQAVVELNGRSYYLGKHGSPESLARYAVLIREYQANGLVVPDGLDSKSLAAIGWESIPADNQADNPITVKHVAALYRDHISETMAESNQERKRLMKLCDELSKHYGQVLANDFGPRSLREQRQRWVKAGNSRRYCNRLANAVVRLFKHAVSEELVSPATWQSLRALEPLRVGQTTAPETEPVKPVAIETVRSTAKYLSPIVRAMLRVHVATGMRPSELCRIRPMDIDRSGEVWMYRPARHKTAGRGKSRAIPIVGDAQDALVDYLNRDPKSFCFSPIESMAWLRARLRAERKGYGSYKKLKANPKVQPGEYYDSGSYRKALQRAAELAKVEKWTPYQLRHLAGTVVRDALGPEAAQALLGHANIQMTEHYAKVNERKAIEAAKHAPKL